MSAAPFTVLVVCTGNVNRSALGAALLSTWAGWYLPDVAGAVRVASAGLRAPVGNRMGRRSRTIAEALGAPWRAHRARQITESDIRSADLILVSSADQRDAVLGMVPAALQSTFTIREAGRIAGRFSVTSRPRSVDEVRDRVALLARNRTTTGQGEAEDDIVDPQGLDDDAYRLMTRQEVPALASLARLIFGMPDAEVRAYVDAAEAAAFRFDDAEVPQPPRRRGRHEA